MNRLAHPDGREDGSGELIIRVQDGKPRFARPMPYPYCSKIFLSECPVCGPVVAGLKMLSEEIARLIDRRLSYLVQWGNGDLHILILDGHYSNVTPVPDIEVEW